MKLRSLLTLIVSSLLMGNAWAADPVRIVSADGSLTEIIYALKQQSVLVGVDTTSGYPVAAKALPQIGYKRNISAEGVLSLAPTTLVATEDSGPEKIINQIEQAGVAIKRYPAAYSLSSVGEKILGISKLLSVSAEGERLWLNVQKEVAQAQQNLVEVKKPIRVMFVLSASGTSPVVSGQGTSADAIIQLAGGTNAIIEFDGYKPIPVESIIAAKPDVILMMNRNADLSGQKGLLNQAGFNMTPAGINQRLITMDGMLLLGFGPRIGLAVERLVGEFYPHLNKIARAGSE